MTSITTRAGKGTPLTHTEVDDNFTNLNADKLEASNNLSDVSSASAARTNLGLGTAATTASTDYATAAQGSLADSAIQPSDLATVATTGAYSDLSGLPALGTAAATDATAYATAAQGALADSAVQPNDSPTFAGVDVTGTITSDGLTVDTNTLHVDAANNRVGIGTASPRANLNVYHPSATDDFNFLVTTFRPNIVLEDISGAASDWQFFSDSGDLQFRYGDASTNTKLANEAMRIDDSGNVGIGKTNPATALDVNGTVTADAATLSGRLTLPTATYHYSSDGKPRLYYYDNGDTLFRTADDFLFRNNANTTVAQISETGAINTLSTVTATSFIGDGSALTNLPTGGLGVDQTPQTVSRSYAGTSYQNTTGKPIFVSAHDGSRNNSRMEVSSNNSTWITTAGGDSASRSTRSAVVPNGWYYRYGAVSSTASFWTEVR